jgi:hypothetical protein
MRAMNRFYHERFFSDVRFTSIAVLALLCLGAWNIPLAYLLVPPVALLGGAQTAFDASYLIFSRHYSTSLERELNRVLGARVLVAHEMEDAYLFPLHSRKLVVAPLDRSFSWFGFMTLLYTALGVGAFGFGLSLGWRTLWDAGAAWPLAYLLTLAVLTTTTLAAGIWWFVGGTGERRLAEVTDGLTLSATHTEEPT